MQHSMLHTIYTLLSVPTQVPNGLLSSFQSAVPLLAEIDSKNYQSWQQQLTELAQQIDHAAQRQGLNHKTVIGFGGGFGAGKSRFINSLLGIDVLPEALEPCTAVPTYLTHSPQESTQACNLFGHQIELKTEQLGQLRHFVGSTDSINLGELIQHVHLGLPEMMWSNIALLDTPGYSKADSQHHGQNDENIALSQLSAAQYVVWLVNAKNGTIRDEDLQFLQKLALRNPIFVVLTQSDLVNRSDLKPIMDGISQHLASKNVAVAGIMAWAAPIAQNRGGRLLGDDILEWFNHVNQLVWQSYQDKLDLLMGRLIPVAQAEIAAVAKQHQQMSSLLISPELSAEQKKTMERHITEKTHKEIQMNLALTKLKNHHTAWSQCITELAIDSPLSVEGIVQQNHSDDEIQSCYEMGTLYQHNLLLSDIDKALSWYIKAATNGHAAALQALTSLANKNNPKACYWLAEIYLKSKLNSRLKAANWYKEALALGESLALPPARRLAEDFFKDLQYQIGLVYTEGKLVQRDPAEAARWYEKAAKQEHTLAQVAFADDLCQRLGDRNKALVWYQNAAHQGNINAAYQAGCLHEHFNDLDKATHYMGLAAKSRHLRAYQWLEHHEASFQPAVYCLAQMYETGEGVNKSLDTAIKKYAVLVRQKYTDALKRLLGLADKRHLNAMLALANIAESDLKDLEQATKWHGMAVEHHDDQKSLQWLYDQSCFGLQDARECLQSLADRLECANLQYRYGLLSAYKNLKETACDYMALAAAQTHAGAYQWLKQLSEKDHVYAQSKMIWLFEEGKANQEDADRIFYYYYLTIRRGDERAIKSVISYSQKMDIAKNLLANCYAFGYGVSVSYENAYELYQKSAGIPNSYYNRAAMLYLGLGVKQDKESAIYLLEAKKDLFEAHVKVFSNIFMLKKPLLVDFQSDKKNFEFNVAEFFRLSIGCLISFGLICFFGSIGFLISIACVFLFFMIRLWEFGKFSRHSMIIKDDSGTCYDSSTNLTWMRCSLGQTWDGTTCVGTAQKYTWDEARQAVAEMNRNGGYAGYTNWVLPDLEALTGLLRYNPCKSKKNELIFPNAPFDMYWSASNASNWNIFKNYVWCVYFNKHAWGVYFHPDFPDIHFGAGHSEVEGKLAHHYVRAVRAGR